MNRNKFFAWCVVKRHLGQMSLKHTRIRYEVIFKWLGRKKLTANSAELFILYLREKNLRNASLNSYIRVINLIDIYERENNKDLNLLRKISYFPKQQKVPTILTVEEIEAIISVKRDYSRSPYKSLGVDLDRTYRNIIWFLASTGCRYSEMANLKKENLHLGIGNGHVIFKNTKTLEDRQVPLAPLLVEELKDFLKDKKPNQFVFTTSTGNKVAEQTFNPELRKRVELAGIVDKHVHAHCFRNSFLQEHKHNGTDVVTRGRLVGHRDPKTTIGYERFDFEEMIKGAENHPLFSKNLPVKKVINKYAELADRWPVRNDYRFAFKIQKTENSLLVKMYKKRGI
jgi:site-specific recombinase XerD